MEIRFTIGASTTKFLIPTLRADSNLMSKLVSCLKRFPPIHKIIRTIRPSTIARRWRAASRIRPGITPNGANWFYQWTKHCVARYGAGEVASWYWEVWNEPNISYWHGSRAEYFKLYDYAVDGVRRALPDARVGGPETAGGPGGRFLGDFLEHCAAGTNYVTGKSARRLILFHFTPKARRNLLTATSAWAWPTSSKTSPTPLPSFRHFLFSKTARDHRRIRS